MSKYRCLNAPRNPDALGKVGTIVVVPTVPTVFLYDLEKEVMGKAVTVSVEVNHLWVFQRATDEEKNVSEGIEVVCKKAALGYERLEGAFGTWAPSASPDGIPVFHLRTGGQVPIRNSSEWTFDNVMTQETLRTYDSDAFGLDLHRVLKRMSQIADQSTSEVQPNLAPGISIDDAIRSVCGVLVLRTLTPREYSSRLGGVLDKARDMLIEKNRQYGNSALDPVRVFSKASLKEQLLVRLDDKVSRIARGAAAGEDVANDILGYLTLVLIAEERERPPADGLVGAEPIGAAWVKEP